MGILSYNQFTILSDDEDEFSTPVKKIPTIFGAPTAPKKIPIPLTQVHRDDTWSRSRLSDQDIDDEYYSPNFSCDDCDYDFYHGVPYDTDSDMDSVSYDSDYDFYHGVSYDSDDFDVCCECNQCKHSENNPDDGEIDNGEIGDLIMFEEPNNEEEEEEKKKITTSVPKYLNLAEKTLDHDPTPTATTSVIGYVSERRIHKNKSKLLKNIKKEKRKNKKEEKESEREKIRSKRRKLLSSDEKEMKKSSIRTRIDARTVHPDLINEDCEDCDDSDYTLYWEEMRDQYMSEYQNYFWSDDEHDYSMY